MRSTGGRQNSTNWSPQVSNPPRAYSDLVILAEIARAGADVDEDGRMAELDDDDCFERPCRSVD
jgi:hypothetical protein